ncbi:MAG: hypothetical protein WBX16_12410, partial [Candidatus Acidiferrales bacterium]
MKSFRRRGLCFLLGALAVAGSRLLPVVAYSQTAADAGAPGASQLHDGQHDFDWQLGTWKIHMHRLQHPLTGSTTWTDLDGTVTVRRIWDGRANLAEIVADGASGHLE